MMAISTRKDGEIVFYELVVFLQINPQHPIGYVIPNILSLVTPFGVKTGTNTYTALNDNIVLYTDTTFYCITENKNTPKVTWTRKYLNGVTTTLSSTTSSTTGLSTLYVSRSNPGFYSCEVEQNGGNRKTYTVLMLAYNQGNKCIRIYVYTAYGKGMVCCWPCISIQPG